MSRHIELLPLPEWGTEQVARLSDQGAGYLWAEAQCIEAYRWYMAERIPKSRASKLLRIAAILFATIGALVPFLALATTSVRSDWGFVGLAVSAAAVLADRAFGFSASWMRYTRTAIEIQLAIIEARARLLRALADRTVIDDAAARDLASTLSTELITTVRAVMKDETAEWATEFRAANNELGTTLSTMGRT